MTDQNENIRTGQDAGADADSGDAVDRKWITNAISELNICRKNVLIYPDEHAQIQSSIERSFQALQHIFKRQPSLNITVTDQQLILETITLDADHRKYKDFSNSLRKHEIVSVTLSADLEKSELLRFLRLIAEKPEAIQEKGGMKAASRDCFLDHIQIKTIDFSKLYVTEEEKISLGQTVADGAKRQSMFHNLVLSLVSGAIRDEESGIDFFDARQVPPKELADFINTNNLDRAQATRFFQQIFQMSLDKIDDSQADGEAAPVHFDHLNTFLEGLNPELRRQFLTITFQHCNTATDTLQTRQLLDGLQGNFVIEMMQQVHDQQQEISPSLLEFIQKMAQIEGMETGDTWLQDWTEQGMQPEKIETLVKREAYEEYVTEEYGTLLSNLAAGEKAAVDPDSESSTLDTLLASLEEKNLDLQIARVLITFMNENIEPDEYQEYSRKLMSIVHEISITSIEDFTFLKETYYTYKLHSIHKTNPALQSYAKTCLQEMDHPLFYARAVAAFDKLGDITAEEASDFLSLLGSRIVPEVVNRFAKYDNPAKGMHLLQPLKNFANEACAEVKKRIHDPRPAYVRNLVILTREIGNADHAAILNPMLDHPDEFIQLETLAALLKFGDAKAGELLCKLLDSGRPAVVTIAIQLSGQYRVQDTVPLLMDRIKTPMLLRSTIKKNTQLIRILGDIGNPVAIPTLEKLGKTAFSMFPGAVSEMKQAIFETLGNYPEKSVTGLLKIGLKMKNKKINDICRRYYQTIRDRSQNNFHGNA